MRKSPWQERLARAYSVDRSGASLSPRFLNRLRRSARKIRSAASSRAAKAMIHAMATTPVPGLRKEGSGWRIVVKQLNLLLSDGGLENMSLLL